MTLKRFLNENKMLILLLFVFNFVFSIQKVFFYNIGYDTDEFLTVPDWTLCIWIGHGRYSLVLLKKIFSFCQINNIYILNAITYLNVFIYSVIFLYFLNIDKQKTDKKKCFVCAAALISAPIFMEQYYFTLQSAEISFSMIAMMIAFVMTYRFLDTKKLRYALMTFPILVFCFGSYQSFVNLYIVGVLICLYKLNNEIFKENLIRIAKSIILWGASFAAYQIVIKIVLQVTNVADSGYIVSQISWLTESFSKAILTVLVTTGRIVLGLGNVLNLSYSICLIYVLYKIIKEKKYLNWKNFYLAALFLSPFLLNIITASPLIIRSVISFPVLCSFIFFEYYKECNKFRNVVWIILASQIIHSQLLMYGDNIRYKNDVAIAEKIYSDCNADANTHIVIIGLERTEENVFSFKGQVMGHSFFEWSADKENVTEERVKNFMALHGYIFTSPTADEKEAAKSIEFDAEYPEEGYIIEKNGCFYVNLGK